MNATEEMPAELKSEVKTLNINLPLEEYNALKELAQKRDRTMKDLLRSAFVLAKIAYSEEAAGNRLTVANRNGHIIKELVIS